MILYADTSALVKLLLTEDGRDVMRQAVEAAEWVASAAIAYAELRAALAAAARDGRLGPVSPGAARQAVDTLWLGVSEVLLDAALIHRAGDLAEVWRLRGYDAVHLAALEIVGSPETVRLACWDQELARAARGLGYAIVGG